tara:strand:+ start:25163 stop:25579 length:417 start_codon:yes stop_codon:yes gene_type:complete
MIQYYINILKAILLLALFNSCISESKLVVNEVDSRINIKYKNSNRLIGLKAHLGLSSEEFQNSIDTRIEGDFIILNLNLSDTLKENLNKFEGLFFDDIPNFKKGSLYGDINHGTLGPNPFLLIVHQKLKIGMDYLVNL